MSFPDDILNVTSGQSVEDMDSTKILDGDEDPILLTRMAMEHGEKKQLQCNKDLWPMITYLHTRLQAVIADNQALHLEVKLLKATQQSTDLKVADVRDECRSTRQITSADIQSIKNNQAYQPTPSNVSIQTNQLTKLRNYAAAAAVSNTSNNHSNSDLPVLQSDKPLSKTGQSSQASSSRFQGGQSTKSLSDDIASQMLVDEQPSELFTEVIRPRRRPPIVRGSMKANTVDDGEVRDGLFDLVKLSHQPFKDFCIKGIPNVEHTSFKNDLMLPDVTKYNEAMKKELAKKGIEVRFVKVFSHKEGDLRSTTVARIGCFAADECKMIDAGLWPANVSVRPWQYSVSNASINP